MSLLYKFDRGRDVAVPKTTRKLRGFYTPLPIELPKKHLARGTESQLFTQLQRGHVVPNPKARIIDHDIADKIAIQDHGMKIRISDQSLNKMSESAKDSIAQLSIIINTASAEQIKAMSDVIGVPIVASLNANRANVTNWFTDMYNQQLEP
jgi:hypothetical protein